VPHGRTQDALVCVWRWHDEVEMQGGYFIGLASASRALPGPPPRLCSACMHAEARSAACRMSGEGGRFGVAGIAHVPGPCSLR
jgi:hypothetical protein